MVVAYPKRVQPKTVVYNRERGFTHGSVNTTHPFRPGGNICEIACHQGGSSSSIDNGFTRSVSSNQVEPIIVTCLYQVIKVIGSQVCVYSKPSFNGRSSNLRVDE